MDTKTEQASRAVGSGDLLGVLREIAQEMRECESQCVHAPKAKSMYGARAFRIEAAIVAIEAREEIAVAAGDFVHNIEHRHVTGGAAVRDDGCYMRLRGATTRAGFYSPNHRICDTSKSA